jgi:hypothetical protein
MANDLSENEQFRCLVLQLKRRNPSWMPADIANELQSHEIPEKLNRNALRRKINRVLERGTIKNKPVWCEKNSCY